MKYLIILFLLFNVSFGQTIGNIYNATSWTDLTAFETNGGFSVSAGKIITPGDATKYIRLPNATMLDLYTVVTKTKYVTGTPLKTAMKSINTALAASVLWYLDTDGKATIFNEYNSATFKSSSALSVSANDVLLETLVNVRQDWTLTIQNVTTSTSVSINVPANYTTSGTGASHNTAKLSIYAGATASEVTAFQYSTTHTTGAILAIGNSITNGSYAGTAANRWGTLIGGEISAGGGDRTAEVLARVTEITTVLHPATVFMMIGGNDILFGVSSGTWQANYASITSQLVAAGIVVYHLTPTPRNATDETPLRTYIISNYSTKYIDTYTALWSGSGTGLNAAYDAVDGTHLNAAGNLAIRNTITAALPVSPSSFNIKRRKAIVQ